MLAEGIVLTARNLPMAEQIEPFVCNSQCLSNQSLSLAITLKSDLFSPTSSEHPVLNLFIGPAPPSRTTHTEAVSDRELHVSGDPADYSSGGGGCHLFMH